VSRAPTSLNPGEAVPALFDPATNTLHVGSLTEGHQGCAINSGLAPNNTNLRGLSIIADSNGNLQVLNGGSMAFPRMVRPEQVAAIRAAIEQLFGRPIARWHGMPSPFPLPPSPPPTSP
jgi:hypothetical protein